MREIRALPVVDDVEPAQLPGEPFSAYRLRPGRVGNAADSILARRDAAAGRLPRRGTVELPAPPDPRGLGAGCRGCRGQDRRRRYRCLRAPGSTPAPDILSPSALGVSRSIWHHFTHGSDPWDGCGHGTRMAGTVAAPHDGANIVGVAWKADLVVIKALPGVWVTAINVNEVAEGIRSAAQAHEAKIVVMAFGDAFASPRIADEIRFQHANRDMLFIAAAPTRRLPGGICRLSCPNGGGRCCHWRDGERQYSLKRVLGQEVDLAAVIGEAPAPGKTQDDVIYFGGSSNASAIVAGVAALVWSQHPDWNRDAVRERLYRSPGQVLRNERYGWGRVNAYRAVGGFWALSVDGPTAVGAGQAYRLTAVPEGDGPGFAYRWNNGATTPHLDATAGAAGTSQTWGRERDRPARGQDAIRVGCGRVCPPRASNAARVAMKCGTARNGCRGFNAYKNSMAA